MSILENIEELKKKEIIGKRVRLVPFADQHLEGPNYLNWLHDHEIIKFLNLPSYLEKAVQFEEVKNYVKTKKDNKNEFFLAIETNKEKKFIGTFKIGPIDWHAKHVNLGILIGDKNYWGKGVASETFTLAIDFCFNELGMHKIIGGCMEPNVGMRTVFEKFDFKTEGVFKEQDFLEDKYYDHYHYGLLRKEYLENKKIIN